MDRRQFLGWTAGGAAGLLLPTLVRPKAKVFDMGRAMATSRPITIDLCGPHILDWAYRICVGTEQFMLRGPGISSIEGITISRDGVTGEDAELFASVTRQDGTRDRLRFSRVMPRPSAPIGPTPAATRGDRPAPARP